MTSLPPAGPVVAPQSPEGDRNPVVVAKDGVVFADSRDVASVFGKEHKRVLQTIRELHCSDDFRQRNFVPFKIKDLTGETTSHVEMSRDGFSFLVMGFTGAEAAQWKERYIEAFNRMEAELRSRAAPIDWLDPKNVLGFVTALQAEVAKRDAIILEQGERLEKLDRIEAAGGSMCISTAAKTLGVNPIKNLFAILNARGWIFKRPNTSGWLARQEKIQTGYLEHADHLYIDKLGQERVASRVMVTAKGLVKIADLLTQKPH